MNVDISITISGEAAQALQALRGGLADRSPLHARIAASTEKMVKKYGRETAGQQHTTAKRLGAAPTRHLEKAYQGIESKSDASAATLLIPRSSRLRAAFGDYTVAPGSGKKYLTIPACAAAYGRRAGEFENLVFMRVGPRMTPVLARNVNTGEGLEILFFLTRSATIKEDRNLLPFDLLGTNASDETRKYITRLTRRKGASA